MRPVEGLALHGLDEFMLRLGHITVLCECAADAGGSAYRFTREAASRLNQPITVPKDDYAAVANYLHNKQLSPTTDEAAAPGFTPANYRYPEFKLMVIDSAISIHSSSSDAEVQISWQDYCFASPLVPSKVGTITTHGKRGSKTGLSHIIDWAVLLEFISPSGLLFASAQLLVKLKAGSSASPRNPYVLAGEKLLFAEAVLEGDFDLFYILCTLLSKHDGPLKKKDATQLYIDAVQQLIDIAEADKSISHRRLHHLISLWRDLRHTTQDKVAVGSTAWHRAASRFETYVDLGLLSKGVGGDSERYEYKYYVSDRMRQAAETLPGAKDARSWIEEHLADIILGTSCQKGPIRSEKLLEMLPPVVRALERATSQLPIRTVTTGLVWLAAENNQPISFGAAKRALLNLATERPEVARLSTGSTSAPEFISLKLDLRRAS